MDTLTGVKEESARESEKMNDLRNALKMRIILIGAIMEVLASMLI
jgi:hypothetical protein